MPRALNIVFCKFYLSQMLRTLWVRCGSPAIQTQGKRATAIGCPVAAKSRACREPEQEAKLAGLLWPVLNPERVSSSWLEAQGPACRIRKDGLRIARHLSSSECL